MTSVKTVEKDIDVNSKSYSCDLAVTAQLVDGSFSHGFGVETVTEIEIIDVELVTVFDSEGDVVINREIIKSIERNIDPNDYFDLFMSSDFH